ncbi:hypothetical protein PFICI_00063 [Pestalotiopsis fici W106-1]|uniref:SMP-30/Gluconolactonase/LRE-like region domain-containing protein n=1 Tax=Pestalotiopsis fici (strain W106-1 / CGMCC3.15140) TaxID=1229662 RepID=W3XJS0_PESFW|nr:uncharacterized protein PFICI_00063 [Pestalotiopsis fici W106-1]ETS86235.1 hypothetical protein PFICI_00063 [Pestalotiopsis fici W106-1]
MAGSIDDLDVVLVTQLPPDSWFEGFAIRPNNHILAARLDAPVVYDIDAADPDAEPQPVFEFPGVAAAMNLARIPGRPDEYSVMTCEVSDLAHTRWEVFAIWHLDLSTEGEPKATKKGDITDIVLPLGLWPVTDRFLLVADSAQSCLQVLDVTTAKSSILLADAKSMNAKSNEDFFGINRISVVNDHIWFCNYSQGAIYRVPFELDESNAEKPVRITGPVELVAEGLDQCDGFQVKSDGSLALTVNSDDGTLMRTDIEKSDVGASTCSIAMNMLINPTVVELGPETDGKQTVFVICCGEINVGWLNDNFSWRDIANAIDETVVVDVQSARTSIRSGASQAV